MCISCLVIVLVYFDLQTDCPFIGTFKILLYMFKVRQLNVSVYFMYNYHTCTYQQHY